VVVGGHAVLFLVAHRHARFEPHTVLWAFHTIQSSIVVVAKTILLMEMINDD